MLFPNFANTVILWIHKYLWLLSSSIHSTVNNNDNFRFFCVLMLMFAELCEGGCKAKSCFISRIQTEWISQTAIPWYVFNNTLAYNILKKNIISKTFPKILPTLENKSISYSFILNIHLSSSISLFIWQRK